MYYFDDSRNRNVLALLFLCYAFLESIFFGYAMEGLYGFLYPVFLDILSVFIISCLSYFLDYTRKMNVVFIVAGLFLVSIFTSLCRLYFDLGPEAGFYAVPTLSFFRVFFLNLLFSSATVLFSGILKIKLSKKSFLYSVVPFIIYLLYVKFIIKESYLYAFLVFVIAVFSLLYLKHLTGTNIQICTKHKVFIALSFAVSLVLYFIYQGGILLTIEPASFLNIILVLAGIIFAFYRKRLGLYIAEFSSLHMVFAYLLAFIHNDCDLNMAFGAFPMLIVFVTLFLINMKIDNTLKEDN